MGGHRLGSRGRLRELFFSELTTRKGGVDMGSVKKWRKKKIAKHKHKKRLKKSRWQRRTK
jgi:hypothetical protein